MSEFPFAGRRHCLALAAVPSLRTFPWPELVDHCKHAPLTDTQHASSCGTYLAFGVQKCHVRSDHFGIAHLLVEQTTISLTSQTSTLLMMLMLQLHAAVCIQKEGAFKKPTSHTYLGMLTFRNCTKPTKSHCQRLPTHKNQHPTSSAIMFQRTSPKHS